MLLRLLLMLRSVVSVKFSSVLAPRSFLSSFNACKRRVRFRSETKVVGYIGEITVIDDHRSGKVVINLIGRLNKCGCISPRFDIKVNEIEMWSRNLLPCRQFGHIVLTTSMGIMDHEEARRKHTGGKVLGFFY